MNDPASGKSPHRRRSWYRRRLRIQRTLAGAILMAAVAAVCWQVFARVFPSSALHPSRVLPDSFWARHTPRQDLAWTPPPGRTSPKYTARIQGVYPYSVVPGGVKDPDSLREAAAHDRAVSRHYAHFDYGKARLVRLSEPRAVYVSYRIRDTIFWTRKKILLRAGEPLLTDGKITLRAKCGNQLSETAQPEVSEEEPAEDVLDQPVVLEALGPSLPLRPALNLPDLPAGPPIAPPLFGGGFTFPYVPIGGSLSAPGCSSRNGHFDKHCHPHPHKKPVVPEPPPVILLAAGLAIVLWRYRNNRMRRLAD